MEIIWIGIALVLAAVGYAVFRKPAARASVAAPSGSVRGNSQSLRVSMPTAAAYVPLDIVLPGPVERPKVAPVGLTSYEPLHADTLTGDRKQFFVNTFKDVPRPPKLLHHLLSPDFVGTASSAELEDLIVGEPLIAAKVLATVNSPLFGLKTQVRSIGQAVSLLGLNSVRSVCLQYILIASFKADSAGRERILDGTWKASALASELIQQLSLKLSLPDQGALVSAVVLSFLGRLATAATMPNMVLATIPTHDLLDRASAEQQALGLSSSEIGRLLMLDWELPRKIVEDAADIDWVLVTPGDTADAIDPVRRSRLALCYLCARLGERLAEGELEDLSRFDLASETGADYFQVWSYFDEARIVRLGEIFRAPEVNASLQKMLRAMREPDVVV